jgi:hypothetical protein
MKTHQEKLNELTTEIRSKIPRLMELSDGCVIENEYKTKYKIYYNEKRYYNVFNDEFVSNSIVKPLSKSYTIIGHEPLLNDVLEWFLSVKYDSMLFTSTCGNIFLGLHEDKQIWDLSKSKLSEQSEQLINFLHYLIK